MENDIGRSSHMENTMSDARTYSIELEMSEENDVPDMLDAFDLDLGNEVTFSELKDMGWRGKVSYSAPVKSLFHKCYDE